MRITLSIGQQQTLLRWACAHARSESAADAEPNGYTLSIEVGVVARAQATWGQDRLDLGFVEVELS